MNFHEKGIVVFIASILTAILMLIVSETRAIAQEFKGSHDTGYIRHLWFYCKMGMQETRPELPSFYHAFFCDCMLDKVRRSVDKNELENMLSEERQEFYGVISEECLNLKDDEMI